MMWIFNRESIIYKEESKSKSIFDYFRIHKKEDNYTAGHFTSSEAYILDDSLAPDLKYIKLLGIIQIKNLHNEYTEYKRKKIVFISIIANIFALSTTIYNAFELIFSFSYFQNFDKYKIIERILSNKIKLNKFDKNNKEIKETELNTDIHKKELLFDNNEDNNENNKNDLIINDTDNENENINNNDYINNNYNCKNESNIEIPKLNFWDFIFNNVYIKKYANLKNRN